MSEDDICEEAEDNGPLEKEKAVFCVFAAPGEDVHIDPRDDLLYQVMDFEHYEDLDFEAEFDIVTSRFEVLLFKDWLRKLVKPLSFYRREPEFEDSEANQDH